MILKVRCDCGFEYAVDAWQFVSKNCSCCRKCCSGNSSRTHGMTKTRTYIQWKSARARCRFHPHYLSHGIKMCARWDRFENFFADMGVCEVGKSIDRINNSIGYEPSNCRWATIEVQMNNRTSNVFASAFGETKTIAMWSRDSRCKTGWAGLSKRIIRGVAPEVAITTPNRKLPIMKLMCKEVE